MKNKIICMTVGILVLVFILSSCSLQDAVCSLQDAVHCILHSISRENVVEATCDTDGSFDEVVSCSICKGELFRTSKSISALGHSFTNETCTRCGLIRSDDGFTFVSRGDGTCVLVANSNCAVENIIIPDVAANGDKVVKISDSVFAGCEGVVSIVVPDTVTTIGAGAFSDCPNLVSVTLPKYLGEIADRLFENCRKLNDVTIPNTVKRIGERAFANCVSFERIVIPENVKTIEKFAFTNFANFEGSVKFERLKKWWCYEDGSKLPIGDYGYLVLTDEKTAAINISFRWAEYEWRCE